MENTVRGENESLDEYLIRLYENKDEYGLNCNGIGELMNAASGEDYNESKWRKDYTAYVKWKMFIREHSEDKRANDAINAIKVERVRLRDERTEYNAILRSDSRYEDFLKMMASELRERGATNYPAKGNHYVFCTGGSVLVCLSDLHYGMMINAPDNKYSPEIAAKRLKAYAERIKDVANTTGNRKCTIALMGDLINGAIHVTGRIGNRENVVQQIVGVAELLSQFVYDLSDTFDAIDIISVPGNHSRMTKKEDALNGERLDLLVPWYLEQSLSHLTNVVVIDGVAPADATNLSHTFTSTEICGKQFWFVHGDYDEFSEQGVYKLAAWRHCEIPYAVVFGHMHQTRFQDGNIKLLSSGCLCGNGDDYTAQKRLAGVPSQLICTINENGLAEFIPVELNII